MTGATRRTVLLGTAELLLAGCSRGLYRGPRRRLVLATGPTGGPYFAFGRRLADAVKINAPALTVEPMATAASVENLRRLGEGRAHLGLTLADAAEDARIGQGSFGAPVEVTALARVYLNFMHLVVLAATPLDAISDLIGRRVAVGAAGSGTEVMAARVLRVAGLTGARAVEPVRLGLADSVQALVERRVVASFWSGGVPTAALAELAARQGIRLLPLGRYVPALRAAYGPTYTGVAFPVGAYGLTGEVDTVGVANYLAARRDLPEDVARAVTALLFARWDDLAPAVGAGPRLEPRFAISTGAVPLHPGAVAYYRSAYG